MICHLLPRKSLFSLAERVSVFCSIAPKFVKNVGIYTLAQHLLNPSIARQHPKGKKTEIRTGTWWMASRQPCCNPLLSLCFIVTTPPTGEDTTHPPRKAQSKKRQRAHYVAHKKWGIFNFSDLKGTP
jgi:hypothetical protein